MSRRSSRSRRRGPAGDGACASWHEIAQNTTWPHALGLVLPSIANKSREAVLRAREGNAEQAVVIVEMATAASKTVADISVAGLGEHDHGMLELQPLDRFRAVEWYHVRANVSQVGAPAPWK